MSEQNFLFYGYLVNLIIFIWAYFDTKKKAPENLINVVALGVIAGIFIPFSLLLTAICTFIYLRLTER